MGTKGHGDTVTHQWPGDMWTCGHGDMSIPWSPWHSPPGWRGSSQWCKLLLQLLQAAERSLKCFCYSFPQNQSYVAVDIIFAQMLNQIPGSIFQASFQKWNNLFLIFNAWYPKPIIKYLKTPYLDTWHPYQIATLPLPIPNKKYPVPNTSTPDTPYQ